MEGEKVVCALNRGTLSAIPSTAEAMISKLPSPRHAVATVKGGVAEFMFMETITKEAVADGTHYAVRCGVEGAAAQGLPNSVSMEFDTQPLEGYNKVGDGYCKSVEGMTKCAKGYVADTSKKPYTLDACSKVCDADPDCEAFWRRESDGHCTIALKPCTWTRVNSDSDVQCWKKYAGINVHSYGNDQCPMSCSGTCNFERQLGVYDRDVFIRSGCGNDGCEGQPCGEQICSQLPADGEFACVCADDTARSAIGGPAKCKGDWSRVAHDSEAANAVAITFGVISLILFIVYYVRLMKMQQNPIRIGPHEPSFTRLPLSPLSPLSSDGGQLGTFSRTPASPISL
eukprot:TRINITY_DN8572_c0_g1_i2.p1 TRINITY_DN8572_c0_g1~~TRINITY_DN8572_c0_g1_i2.p1  ORF type:complete len:342 (+),score=47.98 TRINITY_DN8572_c0_g1_i2:507-1532(+)